MENLKWNKVGKYNPKIRLIYQDLNLPEIKKEVLIFLPNCKRFSHLHDNKNGNVIVGYFDSYGEDDICITDGHSTYDYLSNISEGIQWAEYNRPTQQDKQVKVCENFICKKYNMGTGSKCNEIPCKECSDGNCVNCELFLSQSPKCKNCKLW